MVTLLRIDLTLAITIGERPVFPPLPIYSDAWIQKELASYLATLDPEFRLIGSIFIDPGHPIQLDHTLSEILNDHRDVCLIRESCIGREAQLTYGASHYIYTLALDVLRRLIDYSVSVPESAETSIQRICRLTIMISSSYDEVGIFQNNSFTTTLAWRLWTAIEQSQDLEEIWSTFPIVLIWALLFGAQASTRLPVYAKYQNELKSGILFCGRSLNWDAVESGLRCVFYNPRKSAYAFQKIWNETKNSIEVC